jgi:hypothetical protein
MNTSVQAIAAAAQKIPAYCATGHINRTPAQIQTCLKIGWQMPTTTASNAGFLAGKSAGSTMAVLIVAVIVFLVYRALIASGSRGAATSKG